MEEHPLQVLLARSDCLFDAQQIDSAIDKVTEKILNSIKDRNPINQQLLVLCVLNGAIPFTAALIKRLPLSLQLDYVHASRYGKALFGGEIEWKAYPQTDLKNRDVLVVDDIFDEGHTLKHILDYCFTKGANSVSTAVLVNKEHQRKVKDFDVDYIGLTVPDHYVFGFGMDCEGWGRNLPEIYKLR